MMFPNIKAKTLPGLILVLNKALDYFAHNIDEKNLNLKYIEIKEGITAPAPATGKAIIYTDSAGTLKIKFSDGTIKTFTLT